jgi:DNA-binding response OmpR family regulator
VAAIGPTVIVLQDEVPLQRLVGWWLDDAGVATDVVRSLDAARDALRSGTVRAAVVNTTAAAKDVRAAVDSLRTAAPAVRIVVLHNGRHREGDEIDADLCVHGPTDADSIVTVVRAAIDDDLESEEPHAAADAATDAG